MSERFAWIYDPVAGVKRWCADMWSRRHILTLQDDVSDLQTAVGTIPTKTSELTNDSGYITQADVPPGSTASTTTPKMDGTAAVGTENAFARGDHRHPTDTSRQAALSAVQLEAVNSGVTAAKVQAWDGITVPTKTSDLINDSGFITSAPVASVNGQTGAVTLDATDVGALPDTTPIPTVPTNVSAFTNDAGYLTSAPVTSVNNQTGAVTLSASDVGALPDTTTIPSATSDLTNDSGFITASDVPDASSATPAMDGTGAAGTSDDYARADHVHPHDTTKQAAGKFAVISGTLASSDGFSAYYPYPDGYSLANTVAISINVANGSNWRCGDGCAATIRLFADVAASGVRVYNTSSAFYGKAFLLIIMRTDI